MEMKTIVFDIDGIICTYNESIGWVGGVDTSIRDNVQLINTLSERGHYIILQTARPAEYEKQTRRQLKSYGLKYDLLLFTKPLADYYIDDRGVSTDFLRNLLYRGEL